MVEPEPLRCPRCDSSHVRPVDARSRVRDARFQYCERCDHRFQVAGDHERRQTARAAFEADLVALHAETERLEHRLDEIRRTRRE